MTARSRWELRRLICSVVGMIAVGLPLALLLGEEAAGPCGVLGFVLGTAWAEAHA